MRSITKKFCTVFMCFAIVISIFANSGITVRADRDDIVDFVERIYVYVLERPSDEAGLAFWVEKMENGVTAAAVINSFFNSPEMQARDLTNEEFMTIIYRTFLNREPDEAGLAYWVNYLDNGGSRKRVLEMNVESVEFTGLCEQYGITRGILRATPTPTPAPTATPIPTPVLTEKELFVRGLYQNILGRNGSSSELTYWVNQLDNGKTAATVINTFFNSNEYLRRGQTPEEYVASAIGAVYGRTATYREIDSRAWRSRNVNQRLKVLIELFESEEFINRCNSIGIQAGTVPFVFTSLIDTSSFTPRQRFIARCYNYMFDRDPSESEISYYSSRFDRGMTAAKFIQELAYSNEYIRRNVSSSDYVDDIYYSLLGRSPNSSTKSTWVNRLNTTSPRYSLISALVQTTEFINNCASYGVRAGLVDLTCTGTWRNVNGQRILVDVETGFKADCGWVYCDGYRFYFSNQGYLVQDVDSILGRQDQYYLTVNTVSNIVTVYARSYPGGPFDTPVKSFLCSCGLPSSPTVSGTFTLRRINEQWHVLMGNVWGQYCTQISGNYLFHSVWYYQRGNTRSISVEQFSRLGQNASHGCVRISVPDAKWIWDNCNGSQVTVTSNCAQPFDRPAGYQAVRVSGDYGYDPRDPGL